MSVCLIFLFGRCNIDTYGVNDLEIVDENKLEFLSPYTRNIVSKNTSKLNNKLSIIKDIMNNVKNKNKKKYISDKERIFNNIILLFIYEFMKPIEIIKEIQQYPLKAEYI
jgi:hypothetical protein